MLQQRRIQDSRYIIIHNDQLTLRWLRKFHLQIHSNGYDSQIYPSGLAVSEDMQTQMMDYGYYI